MRPHKIGSHDTPWQDTFDVSNGHIHYYGDNKQPGKSTYRRKHKKQLPMASCAECGAAFQPRSKAHIVCAGGCRAERGRARALAYQRRMRANMDRVETATMMVEGAIGPVLMADTIDELEHASAAALNTITASFRKLLAAKKAFILKDNFEKAATGVEEAIGNVLHAAAKADAKSQGVQA